MPTVSLNAYSKAYPFITNRIRASVYKQNSPYAIVASIIDDVAGHPARTWNFPGLPRENYGFSLDEIDGTGAVISNLAEFAVVPGEIDGSLVRNDEQIKVGTTVGFVAGANSFTFDGTGGKPNYIGWDIVPSEIYGRGILVEGVDYSWDSTTGKFDLLQLGDVFQLGSYYNIHFNPSSSPAGNSEPIVSDFQVELVTSNTVLDTSHFGKKIIVEPASNYLTITLPPIATVPEGRKLMVEVGGSNCCIKIIPNGSDIISFLRGNVFAIPSESFSIYKFTRSAGVEEWRLCDVDGNFRSVGRVVSSDEVQADAIGMQALDGTVGDINQFARIYNELVLNLPPTQVVDFDSWGIGNNKYFYSLANSSNPANAGKFRFPDRRGVFERSNLSGKSGDFQEEQIGPISFVVPITKGYSYGGSPNNPTVFGNGYNGPQSFPISINLNAGQETRPKNILINKYVLI